MQLATWNVEKCSSIPKIFSGFIKTGNLIKPEKRSTLNFGNKKATNFKLNQFKISGKTLLSY